MHCFWKWGCTSNEPLIIVSTLLVLRLVSRNQTTTTTQPTANRSYAQGHVKQKWSET